MKTNNPFEAVKILWRYLCGDSSAVEDPVGDSIFAELLRELEDEGQVRHNLKIMAGFDAGQALRDVRKRRMRKKLLYASWAAASILVAAGIALLLHSTRDDDIVMQPSVAVAAEPQKTQAVLKTPAGITIGLDTLASALHDEGVPHAYIDGEGVLTIEEDDALPNEDGRGAAMNKIIVPHGIIYAVILPDGTKIHINSGSVIEFPEHFGASQRYVTLSGEACFEVASDKARPFIVDVGGMCVKVTGTSFNVRSYHDETEIVTTLVEGSVAIVRERHPDLVMSPGEQARFDTGNGRISVVQVDVSAYTSWTEGFFRFDDITLEEALCGVARWYGYEISFGDDGAANILYNGKVPMYPTVGTVLRKFELSGGVRFETEPGKITVFTK